MNIKKILAVGAIALISQGALAENFVLRLGDTEYNGTNTIRLKQLLLSQHGINAQNWELVSATMLSKSRFGQGTASLRVGDWVSNTARIYGSPGDYMSAAANTFFRTQFYNQNRHGTGVWQILLQGNHKVRRIVLNMQRRPGGGDWGGGGGGAMPFTRILDCASWANLTHRCEVGGGRPVHVRLVHQASSSPCLPGQTFGLYEFGMWVTEGCRGTFEVRIQP